MEHTVQYQKFQCNSGRIVSVEKTFKTEAGDGEAS